MKELNQQELLETRGGSVFLISLACVSGGVITYKLLKLLQTSPSIFFSLR